ncbi:MAG TPA: topoisomerase DNA-binding C4 zinc finger domain-containing protein [Gammaproteobacteria bacterium]|nr:topoisomerase DNA-binding C4 zinc finger domain-containing protein [Gammaproteobacteria bacterium]
MGEHGYRCPYCASPLHLRHIREGQEPFWECKRYPDCTFALDDDKGVPVGRYPFEGSPVRSEILDAKAALEADMHSMDLDAQTWQTWIGLVLDTEDLLEVGELRARLQRRARIRRDGPVQLGRTAGRHGALQPAGPVQDVTHR